MSHPITTIRHLATSWAGNIIAAGEFRRTVHLYDLAKLEWLRTIETILDFGGRRLAMSHDGRTVIAGAYHVHGIAAYSGETGAELWRRKDLKKVQRITLDHDSSRVLCCFDVRACESLNPQTGESGQSLRGVRRVWDSPYDAFRFLERSRHYAVADPEKTIVTVARISRGAISVAFSSSSMCLSEVGGPVRLLDLPSGTERWRHVPPKGTHVLCLSYVESAGGFVGVSLPFEDQGPMLLQRFEPDGTALPLAEIGRRSEVAFASRGERLISSAGPVYDSISGRKIGSLPFPPAPPRGDAT